MTDPIESGANPPTESGAAGATPDPVPSTAASSDAPRTDAPAPDDRRPSLTANPNRPADSGWREPPWFPAKARRERPSSGPAIIIGAILIVVGVWFFVKTTLGVDLPDVALGSLWPILLIVAGAFLLIRSFGRADR